MKAVIVLCGLWLAVAGGVHDIGATGVEIYPTALFVQNGAGRAELAALRAATGPNTYLTSVANDQHGRMIVSTTFHGLYESTDNGASWTQLSERNQAKPLYLGSGFFDDIAAVAYDPVDRNIVWIELAHTAQVKRLDRRRGELSVATAPAGLWNNTRRTDLTVRVAADAARRARIERASHRRSIYLSPTQLSPERLAAHIAFLKEHDMNALVIDFKDDLGRITYDSKLPLAHEVGAVRPFFEAQRVIGTAKAAGIYVIARVVVFKDARLFAYRNHRYALWDSRRNAPWGVFREETEEIPARDGQPATSQTRTVQVEHWVDPFSEFVWEYNIAVARELQDLGVDEIQFDYIRAPADGRVRDIHFRFRADSPALANNNPLVDDRVEALTTFLRRARAAIHLPVGVDVFGFNAWYRMSYLGQDIAAMAPYVDVISPMYYPSHFPREFLAVEPYLPRAEAIYYEGVGRSARIAGPEVIIRPYIQSFLIGGEVRFETPQYTDYLKHQIRGSQRAGGNGFSLWNQSGRYYMVARGLYF